MIAKLNNNTLSRTAYATQKPCPRPNNAYWGDYDATTVIANNTAAPVIGRFLTDSTDATATTCEQGEQHVSGVLWAP
jgi:hypothetical protein